MSPSPPQFLSNCAKIACFLFLSVVAQKKLKTPTIKDYQNLIHADAHMSKGLTL